MARKTEATTKRSAWGQAQSFTSQSSQSTARKASQQELQSLIQKKAYELFVKRGANHGNDLGDWYQAEKLVLSNLNLNR